MRKRLKSNKRYISSQVSASFNSIDSYHDAAGWFGMMVLDSGVES